MPLNPVNPKLLNAQGQLPNVDPLAAAMQPFVDRTMNNWKSPAPPKEILPADWRPGLSNAMIGFWRRSFGDASPTSAGAATVRPIADGARAFMLTIGGTLPKAYRIPWGVVDLINTGTYPEVLPVVDWAAVSTFLEGVPSGKFAAVDPPASTPYYQTASRETWEALNVQFDWENTPWDRIPWGRIPWARVTDTEAIDRAKVAAAAGQKKAATAAFLEALAEAFQLTDADITPGTTDNGNGNGGTAGGDTKKRDGVDWLLVLASVASAAAISAGAFLAYKKSKRSKKP